MSEERKKHVWPWIAALLIALPLLYTASFGPACWLWYTLDRSSEARRWVGRYLDAPDPMDWIIKYSPEPLSSSVNTWYYDKYLGWWVGLAR